MHFARTTGAAALLLLVGTSGSYAQHDQQNEKQPNAEGRQGREGGGENRQGAPSRGQAEPRPQQARGPRDEGRPQDGQRAQPAQRPQRQRAQESRPQQQRQAPRMQQQPRQQRIQQREQGPQRARQQQPERPRQQAAAWQQKRGWIQKGAWQERSTWGQGRSQNWNNDHRTWAQRGGYGGFYIPQASFGLSFGDGHWFRMRNRPTMYMGYPRFSHGGYSFMLVDPWPESWPENWYATDDVYIDYDDGYYLYNRRHPGFGLAITIAM